MEQNKKLAEDLLIETALFYNSGNRSMDDGSCLYESEDGRRCGIGRIMSKRFITFLKEKDLNEEIISALPDYCYFGPEAFLKRWAPLSSHTSFLEHVQDLHDVADRWNKKGISKRGIDFVKFMCDAYKLNKDRVLAAIKAK